MVPLPYELERNVGQPLKAAATVCSTFLLQTLGQPAIRDGNLILIDEVRLGVVDACSGLKMMVTFAAFSAGAVLLMQRTRFEKLMVLLGIVPIAIVTNVMRITATGLGYLWFTDKETLEFLHDLHGWMMMPVGLVLARNRSLGAEKTGSGPGQGLKPRHPPAAGMDSAMNAPHILPASPGSPTPPPLPRPAPARTAPPARPGAKPEEGGMKVLTYLRLHWLMIVFCGTLLGGAGAFAAWELLASKFESYALLQVSSVPATVASGGNREQARTDFVTYLKTTSALIKCEFVLNAALRDIKDLPTIKAQKDPIKFLDEELLVTWQDGSEVVRVTFKSHEPPTPSGSWTRCRTRS